MNCPSRRIAVTSLGCVCFDIHLCSCRLFPKSRALQALKKSQNGSILRTLRMPSLGTSAAEIALKPSVVLSVGKVSSHIHQQVALCFQREKPHRQGLLSLTLFGNPRNDLSASEGEPRPARQAPPDQPITPDLSAAESAFVRKDVGSLLQTPSFSAGDPGCDAAVAAVLRGSCLKVDFGSLARLGHAKTNKRQIKTGILSMPRPASQYHAGHLRAVAPCSM